MKKRFHERDWIVDSIKVPKTSIIWILGFVTGKTYVANMRLCFESSKYFSQAKEQENNLQLEESERTN